MCFRRLAQWENSPLNRFSSPTQRGAVGDQYESAVITQLDTAINLPTNYQRSHLGACSGAQNSKQEVWLLIAFHIPQKCNSEVFLNVLLRTNFFPPEIFVILFIVSLLYTRLKSFYNRCWWLGNHYYICRKSNIA